MITTAIAPSFPSAVAGSSAAYLLVATTTGFAWIDSWHDEQRAVQLVLLCAVSFIYAYLSIAHRSPPRLRFARLVILALTIGVISSVLSAHPLEGLAEVALFGLLCLLAASVAPYFSDGGGSTARFLSRTALFLAAAHVVGAFTRYAAALELEQSLGTEIWLLGFSNPRVASSFYSMLIPVVALGTMPRVEPDRRLRAAAWPMLIGLWCVTAGLEARALWFSYLIATPALLALVWTANTRRLAVTILLAALVGVAIHFALPLPGSESGSAPAVARNFESLTSLNSRDVLWNLAIEATREHPVLGLGPGQFARLGSFAGAHPHNWILQLTAEWGLVALLAVLTALAGLFLRIRSTVAAGSHGEAVLIASTFAVLVGLASSLVDGTLVMPSTQVAFALAFGMMLAGVLRPSLTKSAPTSWSRIARGWIAAVAALTAASALTLHGISSYSSQESEKIAFRQQFPGKWLVPRFWESGLTLVAIPRSSSQ